MSRNLNRRFYKLNNRLTYLERKHLQRLIKKKVKRKIGGSNRYLIGNDILKQYRKSINI